MILLLIEMKLHLIRLVGLQFGIIQMDVLMKVMDVFVLLETKKLMLNLIILTGPPMVGLV